MSIWQHYLFIERLRLKQKVFELNCSIDLITIEQDGASPEEIEALLTLQSKRRSNLHNEINKELLTLS